MTCEAPQGRANITCSPRLAGVAQLVEQLIRNQQVTRSSRVAGSIQINNFQQFDIRRSGSGYHMATTLPGAELDCSTDGAMP